MHLFLFDLYISIDNLVPIIKTINPKKTIICNINPIQNYKKNELVNDIINKGSIYQNYLPLEFSKLIQFVILKLILFLPCKILGKLNFLWHFIYNSYFFSSEKKIEKLLILNKIKTITFEESAPAMIVSIFYKIAKKHNIKVISMSSGLRTIKGRKLSKDKLKYCDYYIAQNKARGEKKNEIKFGQIKYFGSLRYSDIWFKNLKFFYSNKLKKTHKTKIALLKKFSSTERHQVNKLVEILSSNKNYLVKSREKPRDKNPLKCAKFNNDEFTTSELIDWCDVIITARSSSVLVEAAIKNKKIILLEYLNSTLHTSGIYKYRLILKAKKFSEIDYLIKKKQNNDIYEKKKFINKYLIDYFNYQKVKKNYVNFYKINN